MYSTYTDISTAIKNIMEIHIYANIWENLDVLSAKVFWIFPVQTPHTVAWKCVLFFQRRWKNLDLLSAKVFWIFPVQTSHTVAWKCVLFLQRRCCVLGVIFRGEKAAKLFYWSESTCLNQWKAQLCTGYTAESAGSVLTNRFSVWTRQGYFASHNVDKT